MWRAILNASAASVRDVSVTGGYVSLISLSTSGDATAALVDAASGDHNDTHGGKCQGPQPLPNSVLYTPSYVGLTTLERLPRTKYFLSSERSAVAPRRGTGQHRR